MENQKTCPRCKGQKKIMLSEGPLNIGKTLCPECGGLGKVRENGQKL